MFAFVSDSSAEIHGTGTSHASLSLLIIDQEPEVNLIEESHLYFCHFEITRRRFPDWICFRGLQLNDQMIMKRKPIYHRKFFRMCLENMVSTKRVVPWFTMLEVSRNVQSKTLISGGRTNVKARRQGQLLFSIGGLLSNNLQLSLEWFDTVVLHIKMTCALKNRQPVGDQSNPRLRLEFHLSPAFCSFSYFGNPGREFYLPNNWFQQRENRIKS